MKRTSVEWAKNDPIQVVNATGWHDLGFGYCDEMFQQAWNFLLLTEEEYEERRNLSECKPIEVSNVIPS